MLGWFTKNYIFEDGFERLLHLRTVFNELLHLKNGPERTTRNGPERTTRNGPERTTRNGPERTTRNGPEQTTNKWTRTNY